MSIQDFVPVSVDMDTLKTSPDLLQVRVAGKFTPAEQTYWNGLSKLSNLNTFLNTDPDSKNAKKTFSMLDKDIQKALIELNPEAEYAIPEKNIFLKMLERSTGGLGYFVANPLRSIEKMGKTYITTLENTAFNIANAYGKVRESVISLGSGKEAIEKVTSKDYWLDGWNPYGKWNEPGVSKLDEQYGKATGVIARGLLDGKNALEIIKEYSVIDNDFAQAWSKIGTPEFDETVSRYQRNKINFGSKIVDWAGKFAPYKDNPTPLDKVKETLAASVLTMGIRNVSRNKYGEFVTENLLGQGYGDPSTGLDVAVTWFADPLTYLTFGGSKSVAFMKAARTAEDLQRIKDGALKIQKIDDLYKDPQWYAKNQSFVQDVNVYREAMNKKDVIAAGKARLKIALDHPEYDDDIFLGILSTSTVKRNGEEVFITDMETLRSFWQAGEHTNYLVNGKVNNILTMREESVALQNRQRRFVNGLRSKAALRFQGLDRDIVIGKKQLADEVSKKWTDVEKAVLSRPVMINAQSPEEMVNQVAKNEQILNALVKPKKYARKDIARAFGEQLATMPDTGAQIFWSDALVDKTLNTFRSYARLITGDRLRSEFLTQLYKNSSVSDRVNMLYNLDRIWLDSAGAAFTPQGLEFRDSLLQSRYIGTETASITDYLSEVPDVFKAWENIEILPPGISQFMHATEGITVMPFDKVLSDIYDRIGGAVGATKFKYRKTPLYKDTFKKLGYLWYSGSTNEGKSKLFNRAFSFLLLFPKLAQKAIVDEATVLSNVSSPSMLFDLISGKGAQLSKTRLAITADNTSQGVIKEYFQNLFGRNPAKYASAEQRKALQSMKEIEVSFVDPDTGKTITQKEFVTAEEYFGMSPDEVLVRGAIHKYSPNTTPQEKQWLIDDYLLDSGVSDNLIGSIIGATYGDSMALGTNLIKDLYGKSPLTLALEAKKLSVLSKPYVDKYNKLTEAERTLAHYKYFYLLFSKNEKYGVNLSELFFQNRALQSPVDVENFVKYAMNSFGWNPKFPKPSLAKKLNDKFGQVSILRDAGKTEEEISRIIILNAAKEMRYVFNGGTEFNKKLYDLINDKVWKAKQKVGKSDWIQEQKTLVREEAGVAEPLSAAELSRRKNVARKNVQYSTQVGKLTYEEFEEATKGFVIKGQIKTDIGFDEIKALDPDVPGNIDKIMAKGWVAMDRMLNDALRSDVFQLMKLEERAKLQANEEMFIKYLVDNGSTPENAAIQAAGVMANQAKHNAADKMLKYIDNPALKSQFAFNMRVIGRFMRAGEDYAKRILRWMLRHPESIPYRVGHLSHASDGSGILHEDKDGNKYVVIPNDGIFWENVAPAIVMLANPVYSIPMIGKSILNDENWGFFKQVDWNQYTLKVSLLNPSYSENAGIYSFVGPNMALPVIGLRNLLVGKATETENAPLYNFGLSLDNILLGDISDDTNWARSTIPPAAANYFKALEGQYKDNQGVIAAYQAISYLQYNPETAKSPEDFLNKEGVYDPSKAQKFLDEWRIQTANVLAQKAAFNTVFGAPIQLGVPNLPEYLRDNKILTLTQAYGDILRGVLQYNQENGFPISDPYTVAVSMHAAQNPGKLIFQIPKNLNESKVAINYTKETMSWAVANKKFLESFSNAGWIFAPNVGKYDPKIINYMQAADLIPPNSNPFDWNNKLLRSYIEQTSVAKLMAEYYQYDRDVDNLLNDPNNLNRNRVDYRNEIKANAALEKEALLKSNPLLAYVMKTRDFQTAEQLRANFNELRTIVDEEKYPLGTTNTTKKLLSMMVRSASELLIVAESNTVSNQYMGDTILEAQVNKMYDEYNKLGAQNPVVGEAWTAVIKPLLSKVYSTPFRVVRKSGD